MMDGLQHRLTAELLGEGLSVEITAKGGSMRPFIRDGDLVEVTPCDGDQLRRADVAAYLTRGDGLRLHRVWGRRDAVLCVKGDAHSGAGEEVAAGRVVGKVTSVTRDGRRCRTWRWGWLVWGWKVFTG